jgi:hypothetical protein
LIDLLVQLYNESAGALRIFILYFQYLWSGWIGLLLQDSTPNPARGDLFIDPPALTHPTLFVFQRRGAEYFGVHVNKTAAAPLKNKKERVVRALFL